MAGAAGVAGALANALIRPDWRATADGWDAAVTTVDAGALVAAATSASNALFAPRWVREGWYHAYRLLSENLADTAIKETKKNGLFVVPGLGRLVKAHRKARTGRNPQTGEPIQIKANTVVKFRVAKAAKDAIEPKK